MESLIADYKPPKGFDARIVLEEKEMEEYPDFMERTMTLYMAPEKTIQTYVDVSCIRGRRYRKKRLA